MDPHSHSLLAGLRIKYVSLLELRERARHEPAVVPRAELRELAARFPGALRELDQLPLAVARLRLSAIDLALERGSPPEPWMRWQCAYHGFMRAVLRIRRLSRGRPDPVSDALAELRALPYEPAEDEPPLARFDLDALRAIRQPPAGRLNPWVLEQVAQDHGVARELIEKALFLR